LVKNQTVIKWVVLKQYLVKINWNKMGRSETIFGKKINWNKMGCSEIIFGKN
jgi:hypothetical protein